MYPSQKAEVDIYSNNFQGDSDLRTAVNIHAMNYPSIWMQNKFFKKNWNGWDGTAQSGLPISSLLLWNLYPCLS